MLDNVDADVIRALPVWFVATLLSLTAHEAGHALVGRWGGDDTASDQVTLNPAPHVMRQPFGMILLPILSFLLNGGQWMLGFASAPYDPYWAMRFPKRAAWMAAAGPAADFVLALLAAGAIHIGLHVGAWEPHGGGFDRMVVDAVTHEPTAATVFVSALFSVNVLIGAFNLMPLAPLDGHAVVPLFLNQRTTQKWFDLFRDPGAMLFSLMIAYALFTKMAWPIFEGARWLLFWPLTGG